MIDSEVRNMDPLLRKSKNEKIQFIFINTSQWQSSRLSFKNSCMLTDSPDRQSLLFSAATPSSCRRALLVCSLQEHRGFFLWPLVRLRSHKILSIGWTSNGQSQGDWNLLHLHFGMAIRVSLKKQNSFLWPGDLNLAVSVCKETIHQKSEFYLKNWLIAA